MGIALGIDTGGTYTDAVFVTYPEGRVIAGAKALTTRQDLSQGIGAAIRAVFESAAAEGQPIQPSDITLVSLSTTLATNTLAEGQRGRVCLLLIGYDPALMQAYRFDRELATDDVVYLAGGHDVVGDEVTPLGNPVLAGRIRDINSYTNAAQVVRIKGALHELLQSVIPS